MLRSGSSGDDVAKLQRRLAAAGFDPGAADGIFGPKTETALKAFQETNGLAADGIAGPATNSKLAELQAAALEKLSNIGKAEQADDGGPSPL